MSAVGDLRAISGCLVGRTIAASLTPQ